MPQLLRVMSYNILFGGRWPRGDRIEQLVAQVNAVQPDLLALCECEGFLEDQRARRDAFFNAVGMRGAFVRAPSGNHVGLLYRRPWKPTSTGNVAQSMFHGLVYARISNGDGPEITVVATHLNPYSSEFRLGEAQVVLSRVKPGADAIVMGDFNSLPVATGGNLPVHRLLDTKLRPDTQVCQYFAAAGLIDVLAQRHVTAPTYPTAGFPKTDDYGDGVRLDYIMANRSLAKHCTNAWIVDNPEAHHASDHLPVVAEFTLP